MKTSAPKVTDVRPYVIALLALGSAGLGSLSWYQHQELVKLRAASMDTAGTAAASPAALPQPRLEPATTEARTQGDENTPPPPPPEAVEERGEGRQRGRGENMMRELMKTPEFQRALQLQAEGRLEGRFASLFKRLNLPPETLEKLKSLLLEKQSSARDAMEVAREQGLGGRENREQVRSIITQTQAEIDESIRTTIGDAAYNQYLNFEKSQAERATANELSTKLSYGAQPLSDSQYDQLVAALQAGGESAGGGPRFSFRGPGDAFIGAVNGTLITDAVIQQASGFLSPGQLEALVKVQATQRAQREAQRLWRETQQARPRN